MGEDQHQPSSHITMTNHAADLSKPRVKTDWAATWGLRLQGQQTGLMLNQKREAKSTRVSWELNELEGCYVSRDPWEDPGHERGWREGGKKNLSPQITHIFHFLPRLQMVLHTHKHALQALFFRKLERTSPLLLFLWEDDYMLFLCFQDLIFFPLFISGRQQHPVNIQTLMPPLNVELISTLPLERTAKV